MSQRVSHPARLNLRAEWNDASRRRLISAWNEGLPKAAIRKRWGIGPGVNMKDVLAGLSQEFGIPLTRRHGVRGCHKPSTPGRARRAAKSFRKATRVVLCRDATTPILGASALPSSSNEVRVTITQDRTYSRNPAALIGQALRQALRAPPVGTVMIYDAMGNVVKTQSPEEFKREAWAKTIERRRDHAELNRN